MRVRAFALLSLVWAGIVFSQEQTPPRRRLFEVTSVKVNVSGPRTGTWTNPVLFPAGVRFTAINVTLVDVIVWAYPTRRIQLEGGPGWIDSDRFDIVAKADAAEGEVKPEQRQAMVQALLEDRFRLRFHRTTEDRPALALVGKLPAAFQESKEGVASYTPGERGKLTFKHWPITALVNLTSNVLHTPVVDATGIQGHYDFTLDPVLFAATGTDGTPVPGTLYAEIFEAALREQLGFRLERRKEPLEIMVIDSASKPSAN